MTKRITALLLAILMILSAFLMTSCKKDEEDEGEEKIVVENLSAKELFGLSVKNTLAGGKDINIKNTKPEGEVSMKLNLNKLVFDGNDVLGGKAVSAAVNAKVDYDNKAVELAATVEALGEKPSVKAIVDTKGVYITDLLGVTTETIGMSFEDLDIDTSVLGELFNEENMKASTELLNEIVKALETALDKNITEESYTKEMKDVTVDGKEYKGAAVATLTIDSQMAKGFVVDFLNAIKDNEYMTQILGSSEINAEEIAKEIEFDGTVKLSTIVSSDADTIALDVIANIEGKTFAVKYTNIKTSVKLTAGFLTENGEFDVEQGTVNMVYTLDGENEKLVVGMTQGEETTELFTIEGTLKNGVHEGTFTADIDGVKVAIKYIYEGNSNKFKLGITEVAITQTKNVTVSIPMNVVIEVNQTGNTTNCKFSVAIAFEQIDIDASMEMSVNMTSVTVTAPKSYTNFEDINEDKAMGWLEKLQNKYPKIIEFLSEMGSSSETDTVYPNYGYDEF